MLSVPAAMDFWEAIGWTAVRRTQRSLVDVGADVVARALGTNAPVGPPFRAAMRIVELPERLDHDTALALESALSVHHGVEISVTGLGETSYVRVCGQVYNDADDFERLAKALPLVLDQL
jgi:isopenicillin-N epimerase